MTPRGILWFVVTAVLLLAASPAALPAVDSLGVVATDSIAWHDYTSGMALAARVDQPVLLFFYRDTCPYCRKLKAGALTDTSLIHYINANFIPIRVNTESQLAVISNAQPMTEAQLAAKVWRSTAVPAIWLLESDGCRIKKLVGLKACSNMLASLQEVHAKAYGECPNAPLVPPKVPPPAAVDSTARKN